MSVHSFWTGQNPPDLVAVVGYEVGIGLLAVAVRSSLAWSDEKTAGREGLDLLLATPLSASTIAMGKWWGAYREVVPIVFLPVVSAMILAQGAGAPPAPQGMVTGFVRVAVVVVILGQVLIYGAAFVSLGLLLATRLARPARSALATVGLFVVLTIVLPTASETAFLRSNRDLAVGLGAGSPLGGPIATLMSFFFSPYFAAASYLLPFAFAWLVVAGCSAWGLRWWTIHRFDRWMGRIPSTPD
jgi:ABC-type transport system involved in multi-copper enzyme maturation permease subunit